MKVVKTIVALLALLIGILGQAQGDKKLTPIFFKGADAALESAISADSREGIRKAVETGANVNARGAEGRTPLMLAVDLQKRQALAELLAHGADSNARALDGHSAVSLAVENYKSAPDIFFSVMRGGGNPDIQRHNDDPVIMRFVNDRNCDFIRHMKSFGANLDALTRTKTPLVSAAAGRMDWDVVWCLIELGAKYDYESDRIHALSVSLKSTAQSPDSPIYVYKKKVWEFMKAQGIAVPPLNR